MRSSLENMILDVYNKEQARAPEDDGVDTIMEE